jgi:hypothetical protein
MPLIRLAVRKHGRILSVSFSLRSPKNGNFRNEGLFGSHKTPCRGDVMRKVLTAIAVAGSLAVASVATSAPALAWRGGWGGWHGGWGWGGPAVGFAAGALIGSALAAPYYYGGGYAPYGYYGYAPYPYAGPTCVWRSVWNGYTWVRACV